MKCLSVSTKLLAPALLLAGCGQAGMSSIPTLTLTLPTLPPTSTQLGLISATPSMPLSSSTPPPTDNPKSFVEEGAVLPENLGQAIYAERLGKQGSVTVQDSFTVFGPLTNNPEGPILHTDLGRAFLFGQFIAPAFGFDGGAPERDAKTYFHACESGTLQPVTFEGGFWTQRGPVTLDPCKISIVFEPKPSIIPGRGLDVESQDGWWIVDGDPAQGGTTFFKMEVADDGRAILRVGYDGTDIPEDDPNRAATLSFTLDLDMSSITMWFGEVVKANGKIPRDKMQLLGVSTPDETAPQLTIPMGQVLNTFWSDFFPRPDW